MHTHAGALSKIWYNVVNHLLIFAAKIFEIDFYSNIIPKNSVQKLIASLKFIFIISRIPK